MRRLVLVFATGAILAAIALLVNPTDSTPAFVTPLVVTGVGLVTIVLGLAIWVQQGFVPSVVGSPDAATNGLTERHGRPIPPPSSNIVGARIDRALRESSDVPRTARRRIEDDVRTAVETKLGETGDRSNSTIDELLREGTWTEDPRAATFLGEVDHRSRSVRYRDWLVGRRYERMLRATIDTIARLDAAPEHGPVGDGPRDGIASTGRRDSADRSAGPSGGYDPSVAYSRWTDADSADDGEAAGSRSTASTPESVNPEVNR
ncbi:DUF7269 family protein [Halovivax gelatinilyticus]|uniref:DUF7269 family protein n=1 Tax=Halovivax gelatinilyticus TaxID=2961597 RepID=UPI0020CA87BE|nr:hypothetical protein [Halovivax gelatinilyticus]